MLCKFVDLNVLYNFAEHSEVEKHTFGPSMADKREGAGLPSEEEQENP